MKKPHWTKKELDILKEYYSSQSKTDLQSLLPGRSWMGILHKGRRQGILRASIKAYLDPQTIKPLSHDDIVYLAGFLDGEGMFTVGVRRSAKIVKGIRYGGVCLTPFISITNTYNPIMLSFHELLGGSVLKSPYNSPDGKRKTVRTLQITRLMDVKALLEQVLPYLRVKQKQAKLLLEFCNLRLEDKWMEHNPRLFDIANEIRELNKKGKSTTS
jgi:hypothetical protein